jgi:hypothetical protein
MTLAPYLQSQFMEDLVAVRTVGNLSVDRISFADMLPPWANYQRENGHCIAISNLADPRHFLFCFFIVSLLDQSCHTAYPQAHFNFELAARIPKPCGILNSYWEIYHPTIILSAASLWPEKGGCIKYDVTSKYFWMTHFGEMILPLNKAINGESNEYIATKISDTMISACQQIKSLPPFVEMKPKLDSVRRMLDAFVLNFSRLRNNGRSD